MAGDFFGRKKIKTDKDIITAENVVDVLTSAAAKHSVNRAQIQYLYDYYRGKQPVLERTKEIRPEICNRIVENRANEIVSFKVGYLMGEPVQYVNRGSKDNVSSELDKLNEYVFAEDKAAKDKELADWFSICGTAFRMILANKSVEDGDSPFCIYTLDPRNTFVVYHSGLGEKPVMGVTYVEKGEPLDRHILYSVYTADSYYEIQDSKILSVSPNALGDIPIIEYPANPSRLGAFEIVLPLLDAINDVESNRLDGVEQFIQAILMFKGVDISSDDFDTLRAKGGLCVPTDGDVKYLTSELNQTQTQTLVDYMYQTVLTICGMPNRNGGSSTSDTGSAVIMRDGWSAAEARAKDTELMFKLCEKRFLRLAIRIADTLDSLNLRLSDIEIRFTRRNYEDIQAKSNVLISMLSNDMIHPRLAFEHSGMFSDPNVAYMESMRYYEERKAEAINELSAVKEENPNEESEEEEQETDGQAVS